MADTEIKKKFIQLRAKGLSFEKIAKELGKSKQTLINWSRYHKEEIANLKAMELEALQEEHYLSIKARLQSQAIIYNKLREEAESRDFSDVPTGKLLDLMAKYDKRLSEEHIEPDFQSLEEVELSKQEKAKDLVRRQMFANY